MAKWRWMYLKQSLQSLHTVTHPTTPRVRWGDMSEDEDPDQVPGTGASERTPDQPAQPDPSASAGPVEEPANPQPLDDSTLPYLPYLRDLLIRPATPHTAPASRAPTTTVPSAGFTFPNHTAPDTSPGTFCGTALPSAPTLTSSYPLDDTSTAEDFLDDYFQRHISEQDEAQYDSFNDYQLDYSH
ncbi:hypothetical protein CYMTET_11702 [Cymbomonas tetramitiformis]|uniref:Uncharacterized protein n=2 Tax=Cymbomonas tetramitiformis TaxID=36881 RepID=A0AAE0GLS5_9CHLO|nr:hypothetical protein CYMTET_40220 [Cymbomonas tetramitiformis]KAK3280451.1 hypothetical protein CYMTET_11702 [Cymbomonas tetramitiformis]